MKKNNKGFTLIELLAVVVILLAISVMAISSISAAIERNKAKQDENRKTMLVSQGELYYDLHKNQLSNMGIFCISINLLATDDELKDSNGDQMIGYVRYDGSSFSFEADSGNCNGNIIGD